MGRRRRNNDDPWVELVSGIAGLLLLLCVFSPEARGAIIAVGFIGFCVFGLVVVGLLGFAGYRAAAQSRRSRASENFVIPWPTNADAVGPQTTLLSAVDYDAPPVDLPRIAIPPLTGSAVPRTTAELLDLMRSIDWFQFEQLVGLVYQKLGYAVTRRGGANPDGGIDLVIEKDGTRTAVQCKHWRTWNVGVKAVREFLGALTDSGIERGLFVTLGGYTGEAKLLADKHRITVVNETDLAGMLQATDARSDPAVLEILRDTRKLCPKCERELVLRTATKGQGAGKQFWGCSAYPRCRFTMPA